jgi:putative membrane protein
MRPDNEPRSFWRDVWAVRGAVTASVLPRVLTFGLLSALVMYGRHRLGGLLLEIGPIELVGGALVLLMVLRTNAGYDRWWEGRKQWGGIVNQSRNLAIGALAYGKRADREWRRALIGWIAAFGHVCRRTLRGERELPELEPLVGVEATARITRADHMPDAVSSEIARLLHEGVEKGWLSPIALLRCDSERGLLIDHVGACERILKSPLPLVYVIKIRRFVAIYLLMLPFSLVDRVGWATPLLTMLVAYPMLGLDQISVELENPFSQHNLGHLPLDSICKTIESNVLALLDTQRPTEHTRETSRTSEADDLPQPSQPEPVPH